jgi:hypothetical protein
MTGRSRLTNEDGNASASITKVAGWLNELLADDLADGSLVGASGTDDRIVTRSNAGEPTPRQDPDFDRYFDDDPSGGRDAVAGGAGADTFLFRFDIMTTKAIASRHVDAGGRIDWRGVAGENGAVHDHWVNSGGDDTILDFALHEGDEIVLRGHTVNMWLSHVDTDGDGREDSSVINVYSDQGGYDVSPDGVFEGAAAGAHDGDSLGSITVMGALIAADDVTIQRNVFLGAVQTIDDLPL